MKNTTNPLALAAAVFLAAAPPAAHAQTWETIFQLDGTASRAIVVDPFPSAGNWPNLIVTGDLATDGTSDKVFRLGQADDPSASSLAPLDVSSATVYTMGSDALGNLYWAGSGSSGWTVRRSIDAGVSWQELPVKPGVAARGLAVDGNGNLFVCGAGLDAAGYSHWIVQKSADQGDTWTDTDVFMSSGVTSFITGTDVVEAKGIAFVPGNGVGALFVVGSRGKRYQGAWTVTRSTDGGQTWPIVDSWVPKNIGTSRARKVSSDSAGRTFVLGDTGARTETDQSPWVVRMSSDGGSSWQTIFGPWSDGASVYPLDFTINASGDIWITGEVRKVYGDRKNRIWTHTAIVVRLQETATGTWNWTEYPITPEAEGAATARAITADSLWHVYVSGRFWANSSTPDQWFVQRWVP